MPEGPGDSRVSMVLRLSIPGTVSPDGIADWIANSPEPTYGGQLQDFAALGHAAEGRIRIAGTEEKVTLADGHVVALRKPTRSKNLAMAVCTRRSCCLPVWRRR